MLESFTDSFKECLLFSSEFLLPPSLDFLLPLWRRGWLIDSFILFDIDFRLPSFDVCFADDEVSLFMEDAEWFYWKLHPNHEVNHLMLAQRTFTPKQNWKEALTLLTRILVVLDIPFCLLLPFNAWICKKENGKKWIKSWIQIISVAQECVIFIAFPGEFSRQAYLFQYSLLLTIFRIAGNLSSSFM